MTTKLAHHVQGFTSAAIEAVKAQKNAALIKTMDLRPHAVDTLGIWKQNNPNGIVSYRRWFGAHTEGHDANLSIWKEICEELANHVNNNTPKGFVDAIYLPYNEIAPYAGPSLDEYVDIMPRMSDYLRNQFVSYGNVKIIGGNWSVTTPHPITTWDTISTALPHLDYLCLHRYSKPTLRDGHNYLYDFEGIYSYLRNRGHNPPPLILGEFGIDGALWTDSSMPREQRYRGWQDFVSPEDLANQLRDVDVILQKLSYVIAACFFNLDQYPPVDWESYLYANYPEVVNAFIGKNYSGVKVKKYEDPIMTTPKSNVQSLYEEWRSDSNNTWPKGTDVEFREFKAHAARLSGRESIRDSQAYQMGYPRPQQATQAPQQGVEAQQAVSPKVPSLGADKAYIGTLAELLSVDEKALQAVMAIESGGRSFENGKPIIRFELHIFFSKLNDEEKELATKNFRILSSMPKWNNAAHEINFGNNVWNKIHTGSQSDEWNAINIASLTNKEIALQSCSIGAFQIMGFHFESLYYQSAEDMYHGFAVSEAVQAWGFVCFILNNKAMLRALQQKNYVEFARFYNGSGQAERYGRMISDRVARMV